jgi:hypothetical protein
MADQPQIIHLGPVDIAALERSIAMARASSPARDQQISAMLKERKWLEVAEFASYCCQDDALKLKPWQPPPCWMGDAKPVDDSPLAGRVAAWRLRQRLIASGLSQFEPDPLGALHAIEAALPAAR